MPALLSCSVSMDKEAGVWVCSEQMLRRLFPGFDQGQGLAVSDIFASGFKASELPS